MGLFSRISRKEKRLSSTISDSSISSNITSSVFSNSSSISSSSAKFKKSSIVLKFYKFVIFLKLWNIFYKEINKFYSWLSRSSRNKALSLARKKFILRRGVKYYDRSTSGENRKILNWLKPESFLFSRFKKNDFGAPRRINFTNWSILSLKGMFPKWPIFELTVAHFSMRFYLITFQG